MVHEGERYAPQPTILAELVHHKGLLLRGDTLTCILISSLSYFAYTALLSCFRVSSSITYNQLPVSVIWGLRNPPPSLVPTTCAHSTRTRSFSRQIFLLNHTLPSALTTDVRSVKAHVLDTLYLYLFVALSSPLSLDSP
ncbi:hypothetical protein BDN72DRAFT_907331 [Pluteus cervinus]|uniref:Uncharacterized protein n=1 Tax=Pluteus cervinus TaxID=181527 RepID=A0ACD2ZWZ5_9AGAR|nr:hypothetical protein BDN72DRAFT_907331 [Pluteus cervinus]